MKEFDRIVKLYICRLLRKIVIFQLDLCLQVQQALQSCGQDYELMDELLTILLIT